MVFFDSEEEASRHERERPLQVEVTIRMIKALVEVGAEVDANDVLQGDTPLYWAARKGSAKIFMTLLEVSSKEMTKNIDGGSPVDITTRSFTFEEQQELSNYVLSILCNREI